MVSVSDCVQKGRKIIMDELIKAVQLLEEEEYARATEKFGELHSSEHEAFAVLLEETDEASDEISNVTKYLNILWDNIKSKAASDTDKLALLTAIGSKATFAACEAIQVAAMAYKFIRTIEERQKTE